MYNISTIIVTVATLVASSAVCAAQTKVAYMPCGQINDHSWSEDGYKGMMNAKDELAKKGIQIVVDYTESVQPAQAEAAARDYASRGYNPIVVHCGTLSSAAIAAAKAFPNTTFVTSNTPDNSELPKNVWIYDATQNEPTFIAGYLAGMMSKTGRVGAVGGFDFPALTRQMEGYRLGARYANPKMKSVGVYINSWEDAGKAKEAAQAQIDSGADVLLAATDQAARGIFAATESAGVYSFAEYTDQASLAPKSVLGSVLFGFGTVVQVMVVDAVQKKLVPGKLYQIGMRDGVGEVVYNPALYNALPADVRKKVDDVTASIKSGALKIPSVDKPNSSESVDLASLSAK